MAQKFWYYIDFGSGYVEIDSSEIQIRNQLKWVRGEINDFIMRKQLDGNFLLSGSAFTLAETHFITNGFEESAIRIYENGDSGSGVLKYEGWARVKGNWDFRRSLVVFDEFRTNDIYTNLLAKLNNSHIGESLVGFGTFGSFASQGQNSIANKLYNFTWSGSAFSLVAGTPFSIANLGRCASDIVGGDINIYDNVNNTLSSYQISASQWSQVRSISVPTTSMRYSNVAMARTSLTQLVLIADNINVIEVYNYSGGSSYSLGSSTSITEMKFPAACWTGARIALVDELQQRLRSITNAGVENEGVEVGEIFRPALAPVDTATETIALLDGKNKILQAYIYTGGNFQKVGNPLAIPNILAPEMRQHAANQIIIHDTIKGTLQHYTFSGTTWSQTGSSYSIGGGYASTVCSDGTNILLAISDTHVFNGTVMQNMYGITNSILLQELIWGTGSGQYELQASGTGATKDPNEVVFGAMTDIADNGKDAGSINKYKYSLSETLKWYELFQNYWYLDDVAGAYKIKFTQPDLFSTFGTDIDITSMGISLELEQRVYKDEFTIDQEELILNNTNSSDFDGNIIDYQRNTANILNSTYPFTTDLEYLIQIYSGQIIQKINSSGLIVYYKDDSTGARLAVSGVGILSGIDTKNYLLSQSQIYNDHWDTYRYKEQGNILINGASTPVGSSVRNIIEYASVQFDESVLPSNEFPDEPSSLIWDGGIPKSLIMELSLDLDTRLYTALSRLHDI